MPVQKRYISASAKAAAILKPQAKQCAVEDCEKRARRPRSKIAVSEWILFIVRGRALVAEAGRTRGER